MMTGALKWFLLCYNNQVNTNKKWEDVVGKLIDSLTGFDPTLTNGSLIRVNTATTTTTD